MQPATKDLALIGGTVYEQATVAIAHRLSETTATSSKQVVQALVAAGRRAREGEAYYSPRAHAIGDLVQENLRKIANHADDGESLPSHGTRGVAVLLTFTLARLTVIPVSIVLTRCGCVYVCVWLRAESTRQAAQYHITAQRTQSSLDHAVEIASAARKSLTVSPS